jgi:hypothetical protein
MEAEDLLYDSEYSINTDTLSKGIKKIRRNSIKRLGENLCTSLRLVNKMIVLPAKLLTLLHLERSIVFYDTKARILAKLKQEREDDFEEIYQKEVNKLLKEQFEPEAEEIAKGAIEGGNKRFKQMLEENEIGLRETYDALLDSSVVWIWCSFEVLMRELWKQSLNEGGTYLGNIVTKKLPREDRGNDKVQSKSIRFDYLAKYNYDLSKNLGSVLMDKFDFTSIGGIREAYSCAFPKSENIRKALDSKKLSELEATRHVIVHNGGIIDSDFCERTSTSLTEKGNRIKLNNRRVCEYGNEVIDVGMAVLLAVYSYMVYIKSKGKK